MADVTRARDDVLEFWNLLGHAPAEDLNDIIARAVAPDSRWSVSHPINELRSSAFGSSCWQPVRHALGELDVEWHVLISGEQEDALWVTGTGYLTGEFTAEWLGIPPTGSPAALRFGVFHDMTRGKIGDTLLLVDILDLAHRAGHDLLPDGRYDADLVPGPPTDDGFIHSDAADGFGAVELVHRMLFDGLLQYDGERLESMRMREYWHPNMLWYGPGGIGSTVGVEGFEDQHQRPFLTSFPDRRGAGEISLFGDGPYAASAGWPSLVATHSAEYLGIPRTGLEVTMRVMDWWRAEGSLLTENWVLIDLPDIASQLGHELFPGGSIRAPLLEIDAT